MEIDTGTATVIGAVVAAAGALAVAVVNKGRKQRGVLAKAKGSIDTPVSGQAVPRTIACEGKASAGDSEGEVTYLLAVEVSGLVWPKDSLVLPDAAGRWAAEVREDGAPNSFAISLWAVTPQGANEIQMWFDRGRSTNDFSGLPMLPGARRLAAATNLKRAVEN